MRDIFEEIFENQPLDPTESARRNMRPQLRARFYQAATVGEGPDGFPVLLDGRPVRTPARRPLAAPARALGRGARRGMGRAAGQGRSGRDAAHAARQLDHRRRCADARSRSRPRSRNISAPICCSIAPPAGRAGRAPAQHWDPVLDWARDDARRALRAGRGRGARGAAGAAIAAAADAIPRGADIEDAWRLGALNVVTTLTGSALLALALAAGRITVDEAWAAAHVDEDWNMEFWGRDELALQRRAYRFAEMQAAARCWTALR